LYKVELMESRFEGLNKKKKEKKEKKSNKQTMWSFSFNFFLFFKTQIYKKMSKIL